MRRLILLLALVPFLTWADHDPNDHRHTFTADLTRVTGIGEPVQGWPAIYLISRGAGGGSVILDEGWGRPRAPDDLSGSTVTATLLASASYVRAQEYVLVVGGTPYVFAMPDRDTSYAAIAVAAGPPERGPVVVSSFPPEHPSPGDIAFNPTGLTPGDYEPGLNVRGPPVGSPPKRWYQISGGDGGGGGGLNTAQVDARVQPYARVNGGRSIALGDTDFGDDVVDAIDRSRSSYTPGTRTIVLENRDGTPVDGFPLVLPEGGERLRRWPADGARGGRGGIRGHDAAQAGRGEQHHHGGTVERAGECRLSPAARRGGPRGGGHSGLRPGADVRALAACWHSGAGGGADAGGRFQLCSSHPVRGRRPPVCACGGRDALDCGRYGCEQAHGRGRAR